MSIFDESFNPFKKRREDRAAAGTHQEVKPAVSAEALAQTRQRTDELMRTVDEAAEGVKELKDLRNLDELQAEIDSVVAKLKVESDMQESRE